MESHLLILRDVYNSLVNERKFIWETEKNQISHYDQNKHFKGWRTEFPELKTVHVHLLQDASRRVDLAFNAFFRRVKSGETPGYPRFKSNGDYSSFTYQEYGKGGARLKNDVLSLSRIGQVRCVIHRPMLGDAKTCTISRQSGKWFAIITCEYKPEASIPSSESVGIDVGLNQFAALSDGSFIANPRFYRTDEKSLAKASRKLSATKRGSIQRKKAKRVVARINERIRNRRHNFIHQESRKIVDRYGLIAVEGLKVEKMSRRPKPKKGDIDGEFLPNRAAQKSGLNKSIRDAGWSQFLCCLSYKAASAGRIFVEVDPAFTSQDCSGCGLRIKKTLRQRWHHCPQCGLSLDRDVNASWNILNKALSQTPDWGISPGVGIPTQEALASA